MTCKGQASYYFRKDYHLEDAAAKITVQPDGKATVVLTCGKISKTYEGTYDPETGTIGGHVFIRPFEGFGMETHGMTRLYQGGIQVTIHDNTPWKMTRKGPDIPELLVFNSKYESDYPDLDTSVDWNSR